MSEIYYLDLEDVIQIHTRQVAEFGGTSGLRDPGLIEAALSRPRSGYYKDLIEQAAALWESLTMNHGFIDGNKRVGLACTYVFLGANGARLDVTPEDLLEFIISHLEAGSFNKDTLDVWLRDNTSVS